MGIWIYAAYVLTALGTACTLAFKTDRKFLTFLLSFWILAQPVLNDKFTISLPWLSFDFPPNRILFITLVCYSFISIFLRKNPIRRISKRPSFEKYMFIYFFLVTFSLIYNKNNLETVIYGVRQQTIFAAPFAMLTFIVLYYVTKKFANKSLADNINKAIIIMAVVNAVVAIVQIGLNSSFLKTCDPRLAFGHVVRASGVFQAEYDLGYFQILAVILCLIRYKDKEKVKLYVIVPLLIFSILLTFHRLDFIILNICLMLYIWLFSTSTKKIMALICLAFVTVFSTVLFWALRPTIKDSSIMEGRILQDTVSGRFSQYGLILNTLAKGNEVTLFGLGDYSNTAYDKLMAKGHFMQSFESGTAKWYQRGFHVHNGYLEVGILHGVPAMAVFIAFLVSMALHFKKKISRDDPSSIMVFFAVLIWLLCNISNGISSFSSYYPLLVALLTGATTGLSREKSLEMRLVPHDEIYS